MAFLRMPGVGATGGRAKLGPAIADVKIEGQIPLRLHRLGPIRSPEAAHFSFRALGSTSAAARPTIGAGAP